MTPTPLISTFRRPIFFPTNSMSLSPCPLPLPPQSIQCPHPHPLHFLSPLSLSPIRSAIPSSNDGSGVVSVIDFDDVMEKDWSVVESDTTNSDEEHDRKMNRILSAGEIGPSSKVLVSIGSEEFVDRIVDSSAFEQLVVVHESLFVLAGVKEKYDEVKCWQGEVMSVPGKWAPFDVVFLFFLPALPQELGEILGELAKQCLPGGRVVISHVEGRQMVEEQRKKYPDVVVSNLPDEMTLLNLASHYSFQVLHFVDDPSFYLAILKFK